ERPDPDPLVAGKPIPCAASRHHGANPEEYAGERNKVERAGDGQLRVRTHPGSNEEIISGDFLKLDEFEGELPPGVVRIEEGGVVLFGRRYCAACRESAYADFRDQKDAGKIPRDARLTFYTVAGLRALARRQGAGDSARDEEAAASRRKPFLGNQFGSRKVWRTGRHSVAAVRR
ncbi:MAG: hypothetical protein UW78_C0029G0001, partial [Candidatus Azambacteria bacterium GW2011_GWA1_44_9]